MSRSQSIIPDSEKLLWASWSPLRREAYLARPNGNSSEKNLMEKATSLNSFGTYLALVSGSDSAMPNQPSRPAPCLSPFGRARPPDLQPSSVIQGTAAARHMPTALVSCSSGQGLASFTFALTGEGSSSCGLNTQAKSDFSWQGVKGK